MPRCAVLGNTSFQALAAQLTSSGSAAWPQTKVQMSAVWLGQEQQQPLDCTQGVQQDQLPSCDTLNGANPHRRRSILMLGIHRPCYPYVRTTLLALPSTTAVDELWHHITFTQQAALVAIV